MNEQLHIIITGENNKTIRLACSKKSILAYSSSALCFFLFLCITSSFSVSLFTRNRNMSEHLAELQQRVDISDQIVAEHQRIATEQKLKLDLQVASLKLDNAKQTASFKEEKELIMSTAVQELNERSQLIETIMGNIGIKVADQEKSNRQNSGGPFISQDPGTHNDLLNKADIYLETIHYIPLGRPVSGPITSLFGKRTDPLNGKKSFHEGVDFRGKRGERIYATAAGIVTKAFKNGSYGNYVEIDHQNGYVTAYAHMQNYVINKGDRVKRGQFIGQVGNTGRSTGPHLHYEVLYKKKPVNPIKYMKVTELLQPATDNVEK